MTRKQSKATKIPAQLRELAKYASEGWAEVANDAADEIEQLWAALDELRLMASDIYFITDDALKGEVPPRTRRRKT